MMQVAIFLGDINAVQRRTPSAMRCSAPSSTSGTPEPVSCQSVRASFKKKKNDICDFKKKGPRKIFPLQFELIRKIKDALNYSHYRFNLIRKQLNLHPRISVIIFGEMVNGMATWSAELPQDRQSQSRSLVARQNRAQQLFFMLANAHDGTHSGYRGTSRASGRLCHATSFFC